MKPFTPPEQVRPAFARSLLLVSLMFACFAFLPKTHAVNSPFTPDPGPKPVSNTADGQNALSSITTGIHNTAIGFDSLLSNSDANFNTAVGSATLLLNNGTGNTATGTGALLSNVTGSENTANGAFALFSNNSGSENVANGTAALVSNTSGIQNVAVGFHALHDSVSTHNNTAIGNSALQHNAGGGLNTALGAGAGNNITTASNVICIGASVAGVDVSDTTWIGNVYGATTISGTILPVVVSDGGQLGTAPSSCRFKNDIKSMDKASEAILALKPVTFQYKSDKTNTPQFGLIAEEVAKVDPDLVVRDKKGEIYTVRYDAVNAMVLNEFLKEHKKVEAQQRKIEKQEATIAEMKSMIAQQQKGMEVLTAQLKEQAKQIQRVSWHIETTEQAQQIAAK